MTIRAVLVVHCDRCGRESAPQPAEGWLLATTAAEGWVRPAGDLTDWCPGCAAIMKPRKVRSA